MNLTTKEHSEITKSVFNNTTVESSSDLIEVLYEIYKRLHPELVPELSPIRELEQDNWRVGHTNENHIKKKLDSLEFCDLIDAEMSYKYVAGVFLENETISKIYKLDDNDVIGWSILRELNSKRDYCKRLIAIINSSRN